MKVSTGTIRRLREGRGWLQSDLAQRAGLSRAFISQVESGQREPSPVALQAIAEALGAKSTDLMPREITCPHCGKQLTV